MLNRTPLLGWFGGLIAGTLRVLSCHVHLNVIMSIGNETSGFPQLGVLLCIFNETINTCLAALVLRLSFCMGGLRSSGMIIPSRKSPDITKIISRKGLYNGYF